MINLNTGSMTMNPFTGCGGSVSKERFCGRKLEIKRVSELLEADSGNLSVVGVTRIGKTALITHCIDNHGREQENQFYIDFTLTRFEETCSIDDIYHEMTEEIWDHIEIRGILDDKIEKIKSLVDRKRDPYTKLSRLLYLLKNHDLCFFFVFDEFDFIIKIKNSHLFIKQLREIIYKSNIYAIRAIFISRRSLYYIEKQLPDISNLDGVCGPPLYLGPLQPEETEEMIERLTCSTKELDICTKSALELCGNHPYLCELLLYNYFIHENFETTNEETRADRSTYYRKIIDMLEAYQLREPLFALIEDSSTSFEHLEKRDELLSYKLFTIVEGKITGFSEEFHEFILAWYNG